MNCVFQTFNCFAILASLYSPHQPGQFLFKDKGYISINDLIIKDCYPISDCKNLIADALFGRFMLLHNSEREYHRSKWLISFRKVPSLSLQNPWDN